jgi:hypothetical protein
MAKRIENETARLKTSELQRELDILSSYSTQLHANLSALLTDYTSQYSSLSDTLSLNSERLSALRSDLTTSKSTYNDLRVSQHSLETEVELLRLRRDLDLGLDEQLRLLQVNMAVKDGERRSARMEKEFELVVQRWHSKVDRVRKAIEEQQKKDKAQVEAEIAERMVQEVIHKNRQATDIIRVKEEIESQISNVGFSKNQEENKAEIARMQREIDELLT